MSPIPKKTILKNGLRVITVPFESPTVTVLVLTSTGSKYETKNINGISHFLEHMCFKGTKKRPTAFDITKELDSIGAEYNAFTGHEYTGYYAKSEKKHFAKIFDVVSDIYANQVLDSKEIEKEKGVIADEINMYEDLPNRHVQDIFSSLLYGDQPAGWSIAGTKEIIRSFEREDFVAYRDKHYVPEGTIVVVSGGVNEGEVMELSEKAFGALSPKKKQGKEKVEENQNVPKTKLEEKKTDQTHLVLGVRAYDTFHKDRYTLSVLATILGGGMSSRLFQKIRDEMGVGYYVRANYDDYTDHGSFAVSTGVDNLRAKEVIGAILNEFKKIKDEMVPEDELTKVKDYFEGKLMLGLESSDSIAMYYGGQEVLGKPLLSPENLISRIREVKSEDILRVAKEIFKDEKLNLALIGPFSDDKEFSPILSVNK